MSDATRYREIEVRGTPREMGRSIGEAAREEIRGFFDIALERVNKTVKVSRERAMEVAAGSMGHARSYSPNTVEELQGMAEGSGLTIEEVMLLQVRNQLQPEEDSGCTAFSLAPTMTERGYAALGQNWDNDPALDPFTVVLTRRPTGKPAMMTVTQAGLVSYIGLSDAGIGVCMNTLPAPSRPTGVPFYFLVRGIYEARSLAEAVDAVRHDPRAIPGNVALTTPQGPADLEITVDDVHVLRDGSSGMVVHTNHCVHPDLEPINDEFPELIQSHPRKARMEEVLGVADKPVRLDAMKDALRDHEGHPKSICRHPNDHPTNGFWMSVFSVIMEPEAGLMYLSRGNPCEQPYELYEMR